MRKTRTTQREHVDDQAFLLGYVLSGRRGLGVWRWTLDAGSSSFEDEQWSKEWEYPDEATTFIVGTRHETIIYFRSLTDVQAWLEQRQQQMTES
jgi:hypothetical protein